METKGFNDLLCTTGSMLPFHYKLAIPYLDESQKDEEDNVDDKFFAIK